MKKEIKINAATRRLLRKNYEDACNAYADAFCEKHGYYKLSESADTFWAGNDVGGVLAVGDEFVDMQTILTDIDEDAAEGEFLKHNDYCSLAMEVFGSDHLPINFHSWLHGAPRANIDTLEHLRQMQKRLEKAVDEAKREGGTV